MYRCSKCDFNSEFDFSTATHEKFSHPRNPRRELFHCYNSYIEKRLCPEWDYDAHLKVDFDNHVRRGHDWEREEFYYEFHEDIETIEKQCKNCDFKTFSTFMIFAHKPCKKITQKHAIDNGRKSEKIDPSQHAPNDSASSKNCALRSLCFKCDECEYKTWRKYYLRNHKLTRHTPDDQINWFNCAQCSYRGKLKKALTCHVKKNHQRNDAGGFQCDKCEYKAHTKFLLNTHKLNKHTSYKEIEWFKCEQCSYRARRQDYLSTHVRMKHKPDCGKFVLDYNYIKERIKNM